jgi:hypothetical protein
MTLDDTFDDGVTQEPAVQVWLVEQMLHVAPSVPQALDWVPSAHAPDAEQHPDAQEVALHIPPAHGAQVTVPPHRPSIVPHRPVQSAGSSGTHDASPLSGTGRNVPPSWP